MALAIRWTAGIRKERGEKVMKETLRGPLQTVAVKRSGLMCGEE